MRSVTLIIACLGVLNCVDFASGSSISRNAFNGQHQHSDETQQEIDEAAEVLGGGGLPDDGEVDARKEVLPGRPLRPDGGPRPTSGGGVWGGGGGGYPFQGVWSGGSQGGYPGQGSGGWWVGQGAYPNGGGWDGRPWQWGAAAAGGYPMRGGWSGLGAAAETFWPTMNGYANTMGGYRQQTRTGDVFGNHGYGA